MPDPSFVHLFRTLVYHQKNVLRTLVMKKNEMDVNKSEYDWLNTSDSDSTEESVESIFKDVKNHKSSKGCKINILCSHITTTDKTGVQFPFIQYLLEKKVFNYNQLELPSIIVDYTESEFKNDGDYETMAVSHISHLYKSVFPYAPDLSVENSYVGACHLGDNNDIYVLIDTSDVWSDVHYAGMSSANKAWFALPSEIINSCNVCGIFINETTSRFFVEYPELSKLNSVPQNKVMPVPDVGYTTSPDIISARLACMFGPSKSTIESTDDEIKREVGFSFYSSLKAANTKLKNKAMTRYAVFYTEGDDLILIPDYNMFLPMTFHILNTSGLGIL